MTAIILIAAVFIAAAWALRVEFRHAREGLRTLAEAPVEELRKAIRPMENELDKLQTRRRALREQAASCVGRYLAMKDFHRSLRIEYLAQAVVDKTIKLTAATRTAVGIWDQEGKVIFRTGHPPESSEKLLESAEWVKEEEIENVRIRVAAGGAPDRSELDKSMRELLLPIPSLWRQSILYSRVEELAILDRLTGLYVRRVFNERLPKEMTRAAELKQPLSLIMIDIDYFKRFNDTFGHLLGDKVLRDVAQTLLTELRQTDFLARYGGEEMAVILPQTPADGAALKAERLRQAVERIQIPHGGQVLSVTASFGVTEWSERDRTPEEMIQHADRALYRAKENGRNRVETAERF